MRYDTLMFGIACLCSVVANLTMNASTFAMSSEAFDALVNIFSFKTTSGLSQDQGPLLTVFGDSEDECVLQKTPELIYVRSMWQCIWYFDELAEQEDWCFDERVDAVVLDLFYQKAHKVRATFAKYVPC